MAHVPSRGGQCHADLVWGVRSRASGLPADFWRAFWQRWHRPPRLPHVDHLMHSGMAAGGTHPLPAPALILKYKLHRLSQHSFARDAWRCGIMQSGSDPALRTIDGY
ncbi:hypothetical protein BZK31_07355 [Pseudomonas floridensis]|uniref:Uncharacterized protein n=1 Tax=Pseudomonas floridensis TaxID=1958950 RepID=A0A1X0N921_9PSED|nr:hypothetical protein BZK31_07355 [Pseudomonas floridensis]